MYRPIRSCRPFDVPPACRLHISGIKNKKFFYGNVVTGEDFGRQRGKEQKVAAIWNINVEYNKILRLWTL